MTLFNTTKKIADTGEKKKKIGVLVEFIIEVPEDCTIENIYSGIDQEEGRLFFTLSEDELMSAKRVESFETMNVYPIES